MKKKKIKKKDIIKVHPLMEREGSIHPIWYILTMICMILMAIFISIVILSCSSNREVSIARYKHELKEGKLTQEEYNYLIKGRKEVEEMRRH